MKKTDSRKAYDLTEAELVNSDLATLASKAGYSSLRVTAKLIPIIRAA